MENDYTKIVLSVRISPSAKQKLAEEAAALGTSLSEHAERILLNADNIDVNNRAEYLRKENAALHQQVSVLKSQVTLLNSTTLQNLFAQVKGMQDEVTTTDGKTYTITYNSPADLLWTIIHSYKLKQ